jgi:hypothetical protein
MSKIETVAKKEIKIENFWAMPQQIMATCCVCGAHMNVAGTDGENYICKRDAERLAVKRFERNFQPLAIVVTPANFDMPETRGPEKRRCSCCPGEAVMRYVLESGEVKYLCSSCRTTFTKGLELNTPIMTMFGP